MRSDVLVKLFVVPSFADGAEIGAGYFLPVLNTLPPTRRTRRDISTGAGAAGQSKFIFNTHSSRVREAIGFAGDPPYHKT